MTILTNQIRQRFDIVSKNANMRGILASVGIKGASALSMLVLVVLASHLLDGESFGRFTVLFSLASILAVVAAFGQEMLIIRLWNEYDARQKPALLRGAILFGVAVSALMAVLTATVAFFYTAHSETVSLGFHVALFVILYTFVLFFSHLSRAVVSVPVGDGHRDVTALLPLNGALLIAFLMESALSLGMIFVLFNAGFALCLVLQMSALAKHLKRHPIAREGGGIAFDFKSWMPPSLRLWIATILESSNQYLEVVLIGFFLSPTMAGIYFVATRIANGFLTAADGFNMFGSRQIPALFYQGDHHGLARLLRTMALMSALVIGVGMSIFVIGGEWVLGLFGSAYGAYYSVLIVLCIGTAGLAAAGPATQMLTLTGHDERYLVIMALSVAVRIAGFFALIPAFGIIGAALANAASLLLITGLVIWSARSLTGHDPSVLRLVLPLAIPPTEKAGA